jgi:hypothetical protein
MTTETAEVKASWFSRLRSWVKSWIFEKKFLVPFALALGFLILKGLIQIAIEAWLLMPSSSISSSYYIDGGIIIAFGLSAVYSWYKCKLEYTPSNNYYLIGFALVVTYICFRVSPGKWNYVGFEFTDGKIPYLDAPAIAFVVLPVLLLLTSVFGKSKVEDTSTNHLIEDKPIDDSNLDKLGYARLAQEVNRYIIADNYKSSFSIGLIGPWGNGKSSLINLIKKNVAKHKNDNIIEIDFSPYLNHNPGDIISDFFTSFSNGIGQFDGTIKESLSSYSDYLINLYETASIKSLLDFKVKNDDRTAIDLFNEVNDALVRINKKVIVYTDDLDRLNAEEILETLKLMRNTANFHNCIFIVALDKEYVVNTLKEQDSSKHYKFIDKFFQLEIYLPQIPKSALRSEFQSLIDNSKIDDELKQLLKDCISERSNLFDLFINNYRDLKKVVNQLIFEHSFVLKDIDATDFMNFIYLKTNFPKIIQLLNERRDSLLLKKDNRFILKEPKRKQSKDEAFDLSSLESFSPFSDQFIKYIFTNKLERDREKIENELGLDNEASFRLSSLLIALFGNRTIDSSINAVQLERNFYRLMRMTYASDDFKGEEFNKLFVLQTPKMSQYVRELIVDGKGHQLIEKLQKAEAKSESELKVICTVLFQILEQAEEFELDYFPIRSSLSKFLDHPHEAKEGSVRFTTSESVDFIKQHCFDSKETPAALSLDVIIHLFENKDKTGLWGFSQEELEVIAVELFYKYLEPIKNDFWEMSDLSAYYFYDTLLEHTKSDKIKEVFLDFLATCSIDKFCSQMLVNEPFTFLRYKLSDRVKFIFGSNEQFIEFLETHKNKNKGVEEFLSYLNIMKTGGFEGSKKFIFRHLPGRDFLGNNRLGKKDKQDAEDLVQVHIKVIPELKEFEPNLSPAIFPKIPGFQSIYIGKEDDKREKYMVFGSLEYKADDLLNKLFNEMHLQLEAEQKAKLTLDVNFKSRSATIKNEDETLVELIEIQYGKAPDGWKYSNE